MIAVIDYGVGNLASIEYALKHLSIPHQITNYKETIQQSTACILPGVGAAGEGMRQLKKRELDQVIRSEAERGTPILGICLGMQLMLEFSEEQDTECLNLIAGNVTRISGDVKVPHIGWNAVEIRKQSPLFTDIKERSYFYFVNSYICSLEDKSACLGTTIHGEEFCSVFQYGNLFGVQFHPERSGEVGLRLLGNFWRLSC